MGAVAGFGFGAAAACDDDLEGLAFGHAGEVAVYRAGVLGFAACPHGEVEPVVVFVTAVLALTGKVSSVRTSS